MFKNCFTRLFLALFSVCFGLNSAMGNDTCFAPAECYTPENSSVPYKYLHEVATLGQGLENCTAGTELIDAFACDDLSDLHPFDHSFKMVVDGCQQTFRFWLSAPGIYFIDWGDNNFQRFIKNNTNITVLEHEYSDSNDHTIYLFGGEALGYNNNESAVYFGCNAGLKKIEGSLLNVFTVTDWDNQSSTTVPTFANAFEYCNNLEGEIPSDLLSENTSTSIDYIDHMFARMFFGCEKLGTQNGESKYYISKDLFNHMNNGSFSNDTNAMEEIFYGTGLLTQCPEGTKKVNYNSYIQDNWTVNEDGDKAVSCEPCSEFFPYSSEDRSYCYNNYIHVYPGAGATFDNVTYTTDNQYVEMVAIDKNDPKNFIYHGNIATNYRPFGVYTPIKPGYRFLGWSLTQDGTPISDYNTQLQLPLNDSNVYNFYAVWENISTNIVPCFQSNCIWDASLCTNNTDTVTKEQLMILFGITQNDLEDSTNTGSGLCVGDGYDFNGVFNCFESDSLSCADLAQYKDVHNGYAYIRFGRRNAQYTCRNTSPAQPLEETNIVPDVGFVNIPDNITQQCLEYDGQSSIGGAWLCPIKLSGGYEYLHMPNGYGGSSNCYYNSSKAFIVYDYDNRNCADDDCTCKDTYNWASLKPEFNTLTGHNLTENSDMCFGSLADSVFKGEQCDTASTYSDILPTNIYNTGMCGPTAESCTETCEVYTAKKFGYTLTGWYKNGGSENIVGRVGDNLRDVLSVDDFIQIPNTNYVFIVLRGNWEPIDFDIEYHNIEVGDINPNPNKYNIENVGENVIKLQNPSRSGYEFVGWCPGDSACPNPKKGDEAPTVSGEDIDENDLTQEHNTKHFYAMWHQFECPTNKYLHVGIGENDKICMFTGEPENKPVIRIQKDTDEFYIKLIKDINQVMHPGSTKKFHVQLSNGIYNAYDFIEEDATPACGLLPLYKNSYEYDFNNTIEQDGNLYVQTHFDVTTGRCECPSTLTTTNNINCAVERIGVRIGFSNRLFCKVTACLEV